MSERERSALLRHFLAALAYRTKKALRGAPTGFGDFGAGNQARTPKELVLHMTSVLGYARSMFRGSAPRPHPLETLNDEVVRFHQVLADLSEHLERGDPHPGVTPEQLLQGPFSDAMTHAGQLALLRRLHGSPIAPENFVLAEVDPDNVGPDQADAHPPDDLRPETPRPS